MATVVPQATAASAIAEHLSTPPTLNRIPLLRQRIEKERAQLQQTLSSRAKDQVDLVQQGLDGLKLAKDASEQLRDHLAQVEHLMLDPRAHIDGFGKLVEVSVVHRRLLQTLDTVTSLRSMYSRLAHLSHLLAQDRSDPLGPSPNLLTVHFHLTELETFRNETLAQAKKAATTAAATTAETLERYFERLGETIEAFEAHYFRLARELLVLARAGHASVAVKLAKIAQLEGARDQKALAIRMVKNAANPDVASRFRSLQADARTIKHYRSKVLDAIRDACRLELDKSFRAADQDAVRWLDQIDWIYDDILTVRELLIDKFPEDWKIEQVYVKAYHKALYDFLALLAKSGVGADTLLRLSQFPKEYYKTMTKELEVDPDWLQPPLLDGREASLVDDYFALISQRMDEWTANLMKTEVADFVARENPPETDADGFYGMQGAVILFQMLNQQVDLALESNQAAVLARVVDEAGRVIRGVQQKWLEILDQEYRKKVASASAAGATDFAPGLDLYITALANDQIKSADFTEALNARLEPLVSSKYKAPIADKLNEAMDGYLDVAKRCVQILIDLVFDDLRPATKSFMSAGWYSTPTSGSQQPPSQTPAMELVVETLKDYMTDFQEQLNPNLFDLLVEDILDTFVIAYLTAIRRSSKLRIPQACDRMRKDIDLAFNFFLQYKPKAELVSYFDVLESVLTLMSASKMMVFLDYWPFRKKYGPALAFTEALMKARDDLDRSAVNEIMESVRRKVASEKLDEPDTPSIFDRLPPK
ncbi:hypothetical protein JCM3774_002732 [Rhodotorula dairenensis]